VRKVSRDGYRITVTRRGLPPTDVRGLGQRTDEFVTEVRRPMEGAD